MDNYIIFNNQNSMTEGFRIESYNLGAPTPKVVVENVPYMNGGYNFSMLNGKQYYNSRTIQITFSFGRFVKFSREMNIKSIYQKYFEFKNFLLSSGKRELDISGLLNFEGKLKAVCTNVSGLAQGSEGGSFVATFTCDPLIYIGEYGEQPWNTFSFVDGISEFSELNINGSMTIPIYNPGQPASCTITTTGTVELENLQNNFMIQTGITNLEVTGMGTITINFKKEVI
ncbi:hypothetical protein [uncultured Clostridium sp.]|uniref:hypothetical protein n=1 Tax=uncultured Clostridium sp. TaxID=59620 RepID=UPI002613EEB2|nr:hypothetical protein [uncultured Clostridium sp.]